MSNEINIYVACLASYNSGHLHGRWIDATMGADDINSEIQEMLKESPIAGAEEFAIHDYETPQGLDFGEYTSVESVVEIAELIEKYGAAFIAAFTYESDINYATELARDHYCGCHESKQSFIEDYTDEQGVLSDVPDTIKYYIDYEAMARDAFINDFLSVELDDGVHVFHRH